MKHLVVSVKRFMLHSLKTVSSKKTALISQTRTFLQRIRHFSNIKEMHLKCAYICLKEGTLLEQTREKEIVKYAFDEKMLPQMQDGDLQTNPTPSPTTYIDLLGDLLSDLLHILIYPSSVRSRWHLFACVICHFALPSVIPPKPSCGRKYF